MNLDKYFKVEPEKNAEFWQTDAIIHHKPRDSYYRLLHRTMIKVAKEKWEYGWVYQEVKKEEGENNNFSWSMDNPVYTREFSLFDSDFELVCY